MKNFITEDRFELVIQPIISLGNRRVVGCEVLSRLNHPDRGTVYPGEFLKQIDKEGLYPEFDTYIFRKSCRWLHDSLECGRNLVFFSCNFSRKTLCEADMATKLAGIAESCGIDPVKIAIEITELDSETHSALFSKNLEELKEFGFQIFVDDMGSGVTAAEDLCSHSIDIVKIDRSMLVSAKTEEGKIKFRNLVSLAKSLGATVLCEGIEKYPELQLALDCGCDYGQGFLFCAPMDSETFSLILGSQL